MLIGKKNFSQCLLSDNLTIFSFCFYAIQFLQIGEGTDDSKVWETLCGSYEKGHTFKSPKSTKDVYILFKSNPITTNFTGFSIKWDHKPGSLTLKLFFDTR